MVVCREGIVEGVKCGGKKIFRTVTGMCWTVAYPEFFFFFGGGGSTNSEDRGQREQGSGGGSPQVRGSAQFANG
jgi:hypothetical protein